MFVFPAVGRGLPAAAVSTAAAATAAVATATTAAAAIATATTTAAAAVATAATAAAGTIALGPGFIDAELAAANFLAVDFANGVAAGVVVTHFDEAEAARAAGLAIGDQGDVRDFAVLREQVTHFVFGRIKAQIANVDLHVSIQIPEGGAERDPRERDLRRVREWPTRAMPTCDSARTEKC